MQKLASLTAHLAAPAVRVVHANAPTQSHLRGEPNLPPGVAWPTRESRRLEFQARISLNELQAVQRIDWLPTEGALLFFYDDEGQPWGFDPKDRGGHAVLHVNNEASVEGDPIWLSFEAHVSHPSLDRPETSSIDLGDEDQDAYGEELAAAFGGQPMHQVGGYPSAVQNDSMEVECQMAANGVYMGGGGGPPIDPARFKALEPGAKDWRLLFQLDSDEDAGIMWGDCGMLYFWIREEDARALNFSNTWLVLQCC